MSDCWINPLTADYSIAAGAPARDPADGLANAVYLRLMTPLASYWADAALGSRLHELQREKDVPRVHRLAVQYAEHALAPILADGRATRIVVTAEQARPGWLTLLVEVTRASGERLTFKHLVKVI